MNSKLLAGIAASAIGAMALTAVLLSADAVADKTLVVKSNTSKIDSAAIQRMPDGTFNASVCGSADKEDGGVGESGCAECSAGTWNGLQAACLAAWKSKHSL